MLPPGESYTYTSACPLPTPTGTMEGEFGFVIRPNAKEGTGDEQSIEVNVGRFHLVMDT